MNRIEREGLTGVIKKPWGWEYRMWESDLCSLWFLHLEQGQQTSMHCHPTKTAGFVLLKGEAEFCFLNETTLMRAPDKRMVRRGLFHRQRALSEGGVWFLEIETPVDKRDLIRLSDEYGRESNGYEDGSQTISDVNRISIREPEPGGGIGYIMEDAQFYVQRRNDLAFLNDKNPDDIIVFLRGGLGKAVDGVRRNATVPGDIGTVRIIRQVAQNMDYLEDDTLFIVVPG